MGPNQDARMIDDDEQPLTKKQRISYAPWIEIPSDEGPASPVSPLINSRKQREFIPDNKKDDCYWDRRKRNNEAAKRSREKRRMNDMVMEKKLQILVKENNDLRAEISKLHQQYGIACSPPPPPLLTTDHISVAIQERQSLLPLDPVLDLPRDSSSDHDSGISSHSWSSPEDSPKENHSSSGLPLKLRYKIHLGEVHRVPSPNSSDGGDSVDGNKLRNENFHLRSEMQKLASEVASLKNMLQQHERFHCVK